MARCWVCSLGILDEIDMLFFLSRPHGNMKTYDVRQIPASNVNGLRRISLADQQLTTSSPGCVCCWRSSSSVGLTGGAFCYVSASSEAGRAGKFSDRIAFVLFGYCRAAPVVSLLLVSLLWQNLFSHV